MSKNQNQTNQVTVDWCERRRERRPQHCFLETSGAFCACQSHRPLQWRWRKRICCHLCTICSISCSMRQHHSSKGPRRLQRICFLLAAKRRSQVLRGRREMCLHGLREHQSCLRAFKPDAWFPVREAWRAQFNGIDLRILIRHICSIIIRDTSFGSFPFHLMWSVKINKCFTS